MAKTFYITTAIDYTNSAPHIGHAYEKVLADVIARYHRLKTDENGERQKVFFLTGVDQHGQKVQQSAEKEGIPPQQFVAGITEQFIALWDKLEVRYDGWAATTDPIHKQVVQGMLRRLFDEGQIYKDKQSGYYSVRQEQFLTDKERGADGGFGPEWGQVEHRIEENYYFKLSNYKDWLLGFLRSDLGKDFVTPDFRQSELVNAVEKLSGDLCISRPKSRLSWGIDLPFDSNYVNYVWFDALTNYISFIGYDSAKSFDQQPADFREKWPALHVIGKDIMIPAHGIYWPSMLKAVGFPDEQMPQLLVHGWWNMAGAKMSKSAGNVVDPNTLADKYGTEALRYYLMSDIVTGKDAEFSEKRLVSRHDADLANSLGNLLNRMLNMTSRFRQGRDFYFGWELEEDQDWRKAVTEASQFAQEFHVTQVRKDEELHELLTRFLKYEQLPTDFSWDLLWVLEHMAVVSNCVAGYQTEMEHDGISGALEIAIHAATSCNTLIDRIAPWKIVKKSGSERILASVLYVLAESLRIIAILISPALPKAAHGIFDQLNWKMELRRKEERFSLADAEWGKLPDGHAVGKPVPLFPRIESGASG